MNNTLKGHIAAAITIFIWGTTFISTKVLLQAFTPVSILFIRFVIGYLALIIIYPRRLKLPNKRQELIFAAAGFCGVTLYYLLENIALTYSAASNVGIIISVAPFFTALLSCFILKNTKPTIHFFIGFAIAMTGILLISRKDALHINPIGDILALLAAVVWAVYSVLTRKISAFNYPVIQTTRRIFMYGILFMIPMLPALNFSVRMEALVNVKNLLNILFLGFGASALCFVTWNSAVKTLGAVKTSVYIYAVPIITVVTSVIVLNEPVTPVIVTGTCLALAGLIISECEKIFKRKGD